MWLILQIALGIALGYALIHNHRTILRWGKQIALVLLWVAGIGAIVWALMAGFTATKEFVNATPEATRFLIKLGHLGGVLVFFALLLCGFSGFATLMDRVIPLYRPGAKAGWVRKALSLILGLAFFASGFVWSFPVFEGTWIGEAYVGLDGWSRSSGYADGAIMLLAGLTYQWPWLVYLAWPANSPEADRESFGNDAAI